MEKEEQSSRASKRRKFLKRTASAAALLSVPRTAAAESGNNSTTTQASSASGSELSKQEKKELIERHKQNEKKMKGSESEVYAQKSEPSLQVTSQALPTIKENGSYGTQSGNFDASNSHILGQEIGRVSTDTTLDGVTNEAQCLSRNYLAGDAWAWAETGVKFIAQDSGRIQVFGQGMYTGQIIAAAGATASLDYELVFWNQSDNSEVKRNIIWSPSSWIIGGAARQDKSFRSSMEVDVEAGNEYSLTLRVSGATTSADGDAWADAWTPGSDLPGYAQWTSLSYDWLG